MERLIRLPFVESGHGLVDRIAGLHLHLSELPLIRLNQFRSDGVVEADVDIDDGGLTEDGLLGDVYNKVLHQLVGIGYRRGAKPIPTVPHGTLPIDGLLDPRTSGTIELLIQFDIIILIEYRHERTERHHIQIFVGHVVILQHPGLHAVVVTDNWDDEFVDTADGHDRLQMVQSQLDAFVIRTVRLLDQSLIGVILHHTSDLLDQAVCREVGIQTFQERLRIQVDFC